jgi:hypothetical protein
VLRQLQLFSLQRRLRRVDGALDRLQVRYSATSRVGGDFAAQRLQHEFDNLAIDRAIVAHRIERLNRSVSATRGSTMQTLTGAHSAPGAL